MVLAVGFAPVAGAQGELIVGAPRSGVRERVGAIERLMEMRTDESARKFVEENLAPALRTSQTTDLRLTNIKAMRQLFRNFSTVNLAPSGERGLAVLFGGCPGEGTPILLEIDSNPPRGITGFRVVEKTALPARTKTAPQIDLTWENLADKLKEQEAAGLSGSVLVVLDGSIVHHQGYGLGDRAKKISNKPDTIFAIGSRPIDFTKGAILKLEDMGKLKTSDSIARHLPNVPDDKKESPSRI